MKYFIKAQNKVVSERAILTALSSVKGTHSLVRIFARLFIISGGHIGTGVMRGTGVMAIHIRNVYKHQGLKGLVSHLKVCYVITQQALGGHVLADLSPVGPRVSRTRSGLPRCLPVLWRRQLKSNPVLTRFVLSIFAIYRVLPYIGKVKFSTITDPQTVSSSGYLPIFRKFVNNFVTLFHIDPLRVDIDGKIFGIATKSPTTKGRFDWSSSATSVHRAVVRFKALGPSKVQELLSLARETSLDTYRALYELFGMGSRRSRQRASDVARHGGPLGKLALKVEPAGKVRVFAMVDPLTQWTLYPIHKHIFNVLRRHAMDGTFHQARPLSRLVGKGLPLFSLDLSAATDRLPLDIQIMVMNKIIPGFGETWANLLVDRDYEAPSYPKGVLKIESTKAYRYAVGQPMGAYSSWAMLALTHHFIVQVAAWKSGQASTNRLFKAYAILGDDIVIANKAVAKEYLRLLSSMGVSVGLHKSLLSPKGLALEFAKRTFVRDTDVSPVSLKELWAAHLNIDGLVGLMVKHQLSLPSLLKALGYGYKVLGGVNRPLFKQNQIVRQIIIASLFPSSKTDVMKFFSSISITGHRLIEYSKVWQWLEEQLKSELLRLSNQTKELHSKVQNTLTVARLVDYTANTRTFEDIEEECISKGVEIQAIIDSYLTVTDKAPEPFPQWKAQALWNSFLDLLWINAGIISKIPYGARTTPLFGRSPRSVRFFDSLQKARHELVDVVTPPVPDSSSSVMMGGLHLVASIMFSLLRSIFLVPNTVHSGLVARSLVSPLRRLVLRIPAMSTSFGWRTLVWLIIGETAYAALLWSVIIFLLTLALCWYNNDYKQAWVLLSLITDPLASVPGFLKSLFAPTHVELSTWVKVYLSLFSLWWLNIMMLTYHHLNEVMEVITMNAYSPFATFVLAPLGVIYHYGIYAFGDLAYVAWMKLYSGTGVWSDSLLLDSWRTIGENFLVALSNDYELLINGRDVTNFYFESIQTEMERESFSGVPTPTQSSSNEVSPIYSDYFVDPYKDNPFESVKSIQNFYTEEEWIAPTPVAVESYWDRLALLANRHYVFGYLTASAFTFYAARIGVGIVTSYYGS